MWRIFLSLWTPPQSLEKSRPSIGVLSGASPVSTEDVDSTSAVHDLMFSKRAWLTRHPAELLLRGRRGRHF